MFSLHSIRLPYYDWYKTIIIKISWIIADWNCADDQFSRAKLSRHFPHLSVFDSIYCHWLDQFSILSVFCLNMSIFDDILNKNSMNSTKKLKMRENCTIQLVMMETKAKRHFQWTHKIQFEQFTFQFEIRNKFIEALWC